MKEQDEPVESRVAGNVARFGRRVAERRGLSSEQPISGQVASITRRDGR
jgi:hypothetical protein